MARAAVKTSDAKPADIAHLAYAIAVHNNPNSFIEIVSPEALVAATSAGRSSAEQAVLVEKVREATK